jgi:hypothetical protein
LVNKNFDSIKMHGTTVKMIEGFISGNVDIFP